MSDLDRKISDSLMYLAGAERERWLDRWRRWIVELIEVYNLEDPAEIGYSEERIEDFLREHCRDLGESECYRKIRRMVAERAVKRIADDIAYTFEVWYEYLKKDPRSLCAIYALPQDVCDNVVEIAKDPCLDSEKAGKVLAEFFKYMAKNLDIEPSEDLYRSALNSILNLIPHVKCIDWQQFLVAQHVLSRWLSRLATRQARKEAELFASPPPAIRELDLDTLVKEIKRVRPDILLKIITPDKKVKDIMELVRYYNSYYSHYRYSPTPIEIVRIEPSDTYVYMFPIRRERCRAYIDENSRIIEIYDCRKSVAFYWGHGPTVWVAAI